MRLRVMTYNIHRAIGLDRRFRPERIAEILETYDPDIALLQEVDDGVPRSRRLDMARELADALKYPHLAVGHNVTLRRGRWGNATLSRHPIVGERNIDLTIGRRKRRGCQHTAILVELPRRRQRLDVFNVHLGLSGRERVRQLALFATAREIETLPHDAPCLLGGDFNDWGSRVEDFLTQELGFRWATGGTPRPIATFPAFFPRVALDRLCYRGPLRLVSAQRCRLRVSQIASDHRPLVADFDLH
jgi:endonuclease/exonuclease/phosphatase family metal-dependent hydrolase